MPKLKNSQNAIISFRDGSFLSVAPFAKISIGSGFTVEFDYTIIALPYSEIRFGEDCMISRCVSVQSNDGHDIFDVKTGKNTNSTIELSKLKKLSSEIMYELDRTQLCCTIPTSETEVL